ncbi:MAG TPA: helix-turn-helix transcriptional regulator [Clostridia bacterium]
MRKNLRLIEARKRKGLTQEQLARQLNKRKTTISNWENGYCNPTLSDAFKIAELLDADVNDLFFDEKSPRNSYMNPQS